MTPETKRGVWVELLPKPDHEYPSEWMRRVYRFFRPLRMDETMLEYYPMSCAICGGCHPEDDSECPLSVRR